MFWPWWRCLREDLCRKLRMSIQCLWIQRVLQNARPMLFYLSLWRKMPPISMLWVRCWYAESKSSHTTPIFRYYVLAGVLRVGAGGEKNTLVAGGLFFFAYAARLKECQRSLLFNRAFQWEGINRTFGFSVASAADLRSAAMPLAVVQIIVSNYCDWFRQSIATHIFVMRSSWRCGVSWSCWNWICHQLLKMKALGIAAGMS